ncbi:MAG TPA: hypothetical protein VGN16_09330 [Acidobacteriaceae bacterium]|jgi:calcineurin-like phosphoesterase family protein
MTTYFTSDTHFNHANIIGYCKRPFADVFEMNKALIERWNAVVGPDDRVFHLGDFAMGNHDIAPGIFDQLNGDKHLVRGNHDSKKTDKLGWASVSPATWYVERSDAPIGIYLIHNPAGVKPQMAPATVLHGHLHGMSDLHPFTKHIRYIDVGVDCWDYRPVTLEQLLSK